MSEGGYNTNLASEFYVMSVLYRLGLEPHLTLGNKKSVDIAVIHDPGRVLTIDVKAVAAKNDWFVSAPTSEHRTRHFVVLVSYEGRFNVPQEIPRCWIMPTSDLLGLVHKSKKGSAYFVKRKDILRMGKAFEDAWHVLMTTDYQQ